MLLVFESQHRTADQRLAELVAEVRGAIGSLDEYLLGSLVEPGATGRGIHLPAAKLVGTGIGSHIYSCAGYRQRCLAAAQTVAYLASRAGGRAVEGLYCSGEIVSLRLQGDYGLDFFLLKEIRLVGIDGGKLLYFGTLDESHIVFVSRHQGVGIDLRSLLYQLEKGGRHLLAVDNESTVENLVAAVFRIDLREAEYLRIGQLATQFLLK